MSIEIPIRSEDGQVLEVDLNELRGHDEAIIDILKQEQAPLYLYIEFAV